jgi:hypothetical protein
MIQHLNPAIRELDVVALTHDIEEYGLKQGALQNRGMIHGYRFRL